MEKVQVADLIANIKVNADKSIESLVDTRALTDTAKADTDVSEDKSAISTETKPALRVVLTTFELVNTGKVNVQDDSVMPAYNHQLAINAKPI